jgi:hypothetical protein
MVLHHLDLYFDYGYAFAVPLNVLPWVPRPVDINPMRKYKKKLHKIKHSTLPSLLLALAPPNLHWAPLARLKILLIPFPCLKGLQQISRSI